MAEEEDESEQLPTRRLRVLPRARLRRVLAHCRLMPLRVEVAPDGPSGLVLALVRRCTLRGDTGWGRRTLAEGGRAECTEHAAVCHRTQGSACSPTTTLYDAAWVVGATLSDSSL